MTTDFIHLNKTWNAEPNVPDERIEVHDNYLTLSFLVNPWVYEQYDEGQRVELRFYGCTKWRNGLTNDEGWYKGQCRFSTLAPEWGEFYEITGNRLLKQCPDDWQTITKGIGEKHFLFYLKDSTFECEAVSYEFIQR